MNIWDWIDQFYEQALMSGDVQRARLPEIHALGYEHRETNPEKTLALFEEGRQLSQQLNEPWWTLFFEDWCVSACQFFLRDYRTVLDRAVRNALEMRKPLYEQFPMRLSIQRNLVHAYISIDPHGYAEKIEEALHHLTTTTPPESEEHYLILGSYREYALERDDLELAQRTAMESLQRADADDDRHSAGHYSTFCFSGLCEVAWRNQEWVALKNAAEEGEVWATRSNLQMERSEFLLWQAVSARVEHNEESAGFFYRRAKSNVSRLKMPPDRAWYQGLCAFHLLNGDQDRAIAVRRRELKSVQDRGRHWYEARCSLALCELLSEAGQLTLNDIQQARERISRLREPEVWLERIDRLS